MRLDASFIRSPGADVARDAADLERRGFAALWSAEGAGTPFFPLLLAAQATSTIELGTGIAIAFARSPYVLAQYGWELQVASGGRFHLGLGTQVRAHVERRFSAPFDPPGPRLRELVLALRELWASFREERPPAFHGEYYRHDLDTPAFTPRPIDLPDPPILVAAVNPWMHRMAGEVADGVFVHPFHTRRYLDEIAEPALVEGLELAGRPRRAIVRVGRVMTIGTDDADEHRAAVALARQRIAFYASTRAYHLVLRLHGWENVGLALRELAVAGRWDEMPALVTDDMVEAFTVQGSWADMPALLEQRYAGRIDRVMLYEGFEPSDPATERRLLEAVNGR